MCDFIFWGFVIITSRFPTYHLLSENQILLYFLKKKSTWFENAWFTILGFTFQWYLDYLCMPFWGRIKHNVIHKYNWFEKTNLSWKTCDDMILRIWILILFKLLTYLLLRENQTFTQFNKYNFMGETLFLT